MIDDSDKSQMVGQYMPDIGVAPNGRIDVTWWDTRETPIPSTQTNDVYYTSSFDNGATWSRNQENSEVTSMGYAEPTRTDVLSDVTGLAFTLQESKRIAFELYHGLDLSGVVTDAEGNVVFDKASRPVKRKYRVIALGKDGDGPDAATVAGVATLQQTLVATSPLSATAFRSSRTYSLSPSGRSSSPTFAR